MKAILVLLLSAWISFAAPANAQSKVVIEQNGTPMTAMVMGEGTHALILVHGSHFLRGEYFFHEYGSHIGASLAKAGFRVIAPYWAYESNRSSDGVASTAAALAYALANGAKKVSLIGMSLGGEVTAGFAQSQADGTFDTVIEISSVNDRGYALPKTKKLLVLLSGDKYAVWQPKVFDESTEPKQILKIEGYGHAIRDLTAKQPDLVERLVEVLRKADDDRSK
jgi:pimeloyl-ACP methyl ester carboxylesterase